MGFLDDLISGVKEVVEVSGGQSKYRELQNNENRASQAWTRARDRVAAGYDSSDSSNKAMQDYFRAKIAREDFENTARKHGIKLKKNPWD